MLFYEEETGLHKYTYKASFTVAKDKDKLLDYMRRKHPRAEIGRTITFKFLQQDSTPTSRGDYIELKFDTPQAKPITGWSIIPFISCRISRDQVNVYSERGDLMHSSCRILIRAKPDAVCRLLYRIPVEGMVKPVTLVIHRTLEGRVLGIIDLIDVLDTLNEAHFSRKKWKSLGSALGLCDSTVEAIQTNHLRDEERCLRQCLVRWLQRADGVDAKGDPTMASLCDALEKIGERAAAEHIRSKNNVDTDSNDDPELCYYREALKTTVTCHLTKAVVQGEARVGKTAFKSLLLDEKYIKESTSIAEPRVGIHRYRRHESRDTGKRYELLNVTELEKIVKNALKKDALEKSISSPVENEAIDGKEKSISSPLENEASDGKEKSISSPVEKEASDGNNGNESRSVGNETPDQAIDGLVEGNEATDGDGAPGEAFSNESKSLPSKVIEKVFEGLQRSSGKENHLEGAHWLYLIDTGGQIAFQKLLPIFMPFAQVLILVVDLPKKLSSQSSGVMHIEGKDHIDGSPHHLPIEEILKQTISSIASGMQHFRDSYKYHKVLHNLVPEILEILAIGTHRDECSSDTEESKLTLAEKLAEIIDANDDCKSVGDKLTVQVHEIDGRIAEIPVESRIETNATIKERKLDFKNTMSSLSKVHKLLKDIEKKINIPFFYYFFDIVLRVAVEQGCGILKYSTCKSLGEELKLSEDEVMESLNFLHQINSIIYYHDSKACSDLVFVNIGSLIGILKELVVPVYKYHSNKKIYTGDKDGIIKGMLSESEFKKICNEQLDPIEKELKDNDIAMKLLKLFAELSIATPIDDKHFIPALLPVRNVTDTNPFKDREPLLFYFKKATPMGLFCSVVTCLLSWSTYKIAFIESNFSNYIELKYSTEGVKLFYIVLVEQMNCIEVHCEEQRGEGVVREDVREAITSAAAKHHLSDNHRIPDLRFYCSCKHAITHEGQSAGPHESGTAGGGAGSRGGGAGASSDRGGVSKGKKHTVEVETVNKEHTFRCSENPLTKWEHEKPLWNSWLDTK
uniref:Death domain-containing protein n=1 Tax=Amphimedon queenslandica TaxID=400682 RepID=A0A1X7TE11_AMPQE